MSKAPFSEVTLLREQTLWKDSKGRILFIYRRWFKWSDKGHVADDIDIVVLDTLTLTRRPYSEVVALITDGKMKYAGTMIDTREVLS